MSLILDSGERRTFSSGAVRDISDEKGRMDLLPFDIVSRLVSLDLAEVLDLYKEAFGLSLIFKRMNKFAETKEPIELYALLREFISAQYPNVETALIELSIHYQQGAQKYCERNWEKGINAHCFVDSALRHGVKYCRGDKDEPHDRAFMWNLIGLLWTLEHKPEYDDLPPAQNLK